MKQVEKPFQHPSIIEREADVLVPLLMSLLFRS